MPGECFEVDRLAGRIGDREERDAHRAAVGRGEPQHVVDAGRVNARHVERGGLEARAPFGDVGHGRRGEVGRPRGRVVPLRVGEAGRDADPDVVVELDHVVDHRARSHWKVLQPELEWDFRLPRVVSINTSGHKYGLVYPGLGWVVWRSEEVLPEELVFRVSYLGGSMPTLALNFSRPGAQVLLQYFLFLRLGVAGYTAVQQASQDVALYLSKAISEIDAFELVSDGSDIPVFAWRLKAGHTDKWNLFHLQDRLRQKGWLVPAYPMPDDLSDRIVQRIVVRNGLSMDLAEDLLRDIRSETEYLDALETPMPAEGARPGFHH